MDAKIRKAYAFHKEHGGWATPPGRAACALNAARDEAWLDGLEEAGRASFEFEYDDEPYEHGIFTDEEVAAKFESNEWTGPYGAILRIDGNVVAGLWGIVFDQWGTDDPYARVVRAELASEARYEFEREQTERERAANMDVATI